MTNPQPQGGEIETRVEPWMREAACKILDQYELLSDEFAEWTFSADQMAAIIARHAPARETPEEEAERIRWQDEMRKSLSLTEELTKKLRADVERLTRERDEAQAACGACYPVLFAAVSGRRVQCGGEWIIEAQHSERQVQDAWNAYEKATK